MALTITTTSTGEVLTTRDQVKDLLGIVGSSDDTLLDTLILRTGVATAQHCRRPTWFRQTYLETLPGYGGALLQVSRTPIRSLTSITLRGETITGAVIEDDEAGWIYREAGWEWTKTVNWSLTETIVAGGELPLFSVTYQAGYLFAASASSEGRTLPHDVEQAAIEAVKAWYLTRAENQAIASKRIGSLALEYRDWSAESDAHILPPSSRSLLRPYLRMM